MESVKECLTCNQTLMTRAKFCSSCGQKLQCKELICGKPKEVPSAASGSEAAQIYDGLLQRIRKKNTETCISDEEERIRRFKKLCKQFGDDLIEVDAFYSKLIQIVGLSVIEEIISDLARLLPDQKKRVSLMEYHKKGVNKSISQSDDDYLLFGSSPTPSKTTSDTSSLQSDKSDDSNKSQSVIKGPHNWGSDNKQKKKKCNICGKEFHWLRRRHQCRICAEYQCEKCMKFLIVPDGQANSNAKKFDGNSVTPQRICLNCCPALEPLQDDLVKGSNQHQENVGKFSRVPYMNSTMEMEIAAGARSVQRFFSTGVYYTGVIKDHYIPVKLIKDAIGLAFFTNYKFGFIVSGAGGTGIAIAKLPNGNWSAPISLAVHGLSIGLKAGVEFAYYMLVLRSENAIKSLASGSIGLDAAADIAIGPFGRAATATAGGGKGGMSTSLMYAHCRGLYAGISLGGQLLRIRKNVNRGFYGRDVDPVDILSGKIEPPRSAQPLYEAIDQAYIQASELEKKKELEEEKKLEEKMKRQSITKVEERSSSNTSKIDQNIEKKPSTRSNTIKDSSLKTLPNAATGNEASEIYHEVLNIVEKSSGPGALEGFKNNCKDYGQGNLSSTEFHQRLNKLLGKKTFHEVFPKLLRLIPDEKKRQALFDESKKKLKGKSVKKTDFNVPEYVSGEEGLALHASIIDEVRRITKNEEAVISFKSNCKSYGKNEITADEFYSTLYYSLGAVECANLLPKLVQLLPKEKQRKELMKRMYGK